MAVVCILPVASILKPPESPADRVAVGVPPAILVTANFAEDVAVEDVREADVGQLAAAQDARDRLPDGAETEQRDPGPLGRTSSRHVISFQLSAFSSRLSAELLALIVPLFSILPASGASRHARFVS